MRGKELHRHSRPPRTALRSRLRGKTPKKRALAPILQMAHIAAERVLLGHTLSHTPNPINPINPINISTPNFLPSPTSQLVGKQALQADPETEDTPLALLCWSLELAEHKQQETAKRIHKERKLAKCRPISTALPKACSGV